jgi:DNA polymerase-1
MIKKLILIDGHALIHRAFHALPPLNSPKGVPTNAVYGFTSVLLKMLKDIKPDYVAATFDLAGATFRHEEFAEYKGTRQKAPDELISQFALVKEVVATFGIPIYEMAGYEADDVIGSLACLSKKEKNLQTIIMTGDLDTLQLVEDEKVVVLTLRKGVTDTVIYDEKEVMTRYGLKPSQLPDFKGLKGDPSDNIPGVPGIGDKTASTLMQEFGSLEKLFATLEEKAPASLSPKLVEKLQEHKDIALFSKRLATIVCNLDIDFEIANADWKKNFEQERLETLLKELGIYSLAKRIPEALGHIQEPVQPPIFKRETISVHDVLEKDLLESKKIAIDIGGDQLLVATDATHTGKLPLQQHGFFKKPLLVGHDIKQLLKHLTHHGITTENPLFDTKIAAYILNPDQRDYDLYKVWYAATGESADEKIEVRPTYIWQLAEKLMSALRKADLAKVFDDIEMPLVRVLAAMELRGIKIDVKALSKLLASTNKELAKLEKKIYKLAGTEFNINSPSQLGEVLFHKLGITGRIRKTSGGALSTAAPELEKLRDAHPIISFVLEYRELQKLKSTYIEPFPSLVDTTGRIHTNYNQTVAATGRLSSQDPNLQNIPTRTELGQEFRKSFIAEKGFELVSFDYSQLELRLAAHIAKDKTMIDTFKREEDIHTRTAAEIFKVAPEDVTKDMRRQAKVLNFGIIYGMGTLGFARASGVDRNQAREFIDAYFKEFKGVAAYMEAMKKKAARDGYVETVFGRKRYLPDIKSTMPQLQAQAERMAINHPVQGTEADLIKLAMINIDAYLRKENLETDVRMLLQVHDELVFEIKKGVAAKVLQPIKKLMEDVYSFDVPIVVDIKSGPNWADMKPIA